MKKKFFFGRLQFRSLSTKKKKNLELFKKNFNISSIKPKSNIILEIGFGMGENMIRLAKENADQNIIGVEPLLNGQCNLADYCLNNSVKNIYIYTDPAQIFFRKYPKLNFNCCYILFPDPWHKKKHNKRRLINSEFLQKLVMRTKTVYFFK